MTPPAGGRPARGGRAPLLRVDPRERPGEGSLRGCLGRRPRSDIGARNAGDPPGSPLVTRLRAGATACGCSSPPRSADRREGRPGSPRWRAGASSRSPCPVDVLALPYLLAADHCDVAAHPFGVADADLAASIAAVGNGRLPEVNAVEIVEAIQLAAFVGQELIACAGRRD